MKIIKSIIISFSLYSRIPMPHFNWDERDMKHAIDFLPLVGAVIGAALWAVYKIDESLFDIPNPALVLVFMAVPVMITGGFHLDGFMDVADARNSYLPPKRKLEILKDPHIGAFAVIRLSLVGLIWGAALYTILDKCQDADNMSYFWVYVVTFSYMRALCGVTSMTYKRAKKDGMLNAETAGAGHFDLAILVVFAILGAALMLFISPVAGCMSIAASILFSLYYRNMCYREFGGVTGDTAGYFVVMAELTVTVMLGILSAVTY